MAIDRRVRQVCILLELAPLIDSAWEMDDPRYHRDECREVRRYAAKLPENALMILANEALLYGCKCGYCLPCGALWVLDALTAASDTRIGL